MRIPKSALEVQEFMYKKQDERVMNIRSSISEKIPGVDSYMVQFKVWDKKDTGVVTGKYN